jgi:hypothetical protein
MSKLVHTSKGPWLGAAKSVFKIEVRPPSIELTVTADSEKIAQKAAEEFVSTAFANALWFWDYAEVINDDEGQPLGEVSIEMPDEGMLYADQIILEVTERTTGSGLPWLPGGEA